MERKGNLTSTLVQRDRACIWHPFTQMQTARDPIPIVRGEGAYLYAEDGKRYLDAISSWWVNLHGHAHPYIVERIKEQAATLEHVLFADFTHLPGIELAERLLSLLPGNMSRIFYADNGSTAVEAALKMAIQYWHNLDPITSRKKVICFNRGYHGDTFGAMSAAGKNEFNRPFWSHLFQVETIDPPFQGVESQSQLRAILSKNESACFIFEPLVLGTGGMWIYPAKNLNALLRICKEHSVITIADEVMTGFGRTGPLFACEYLQEASDIICMSKGLTGGFLPMSATACKSHIFDAFLSNEKSKAFLHGHSYTGNPLACSAALASLDLVTSEECTLQRKMIAQSHRDFCMKWKGHPRLQRCESIGTLLVLEFWSNQAASYFNELRDYLYHYFLENGILLRPLGNILYLMPPYCITADELQSIYAHIEIVLENMS